MNTQNLLSVLLSIVVQSWLDPTNTFNPGIGKTSKKKDWK